MNAPLFILAPARSYTSLVGGMIGQHPQLYGLPELHLGHADTLGHVLSTLRGPLEFGLAGLLRLLAQLHEGEQSEDAVIRARQWITRRSHWTTAQVFAHIQEQVGPRILVEKSPPNTMRIENLRRLHRIFPQASFLHLTRHPRTACKSAMELRRSLRDGEIGGRPIQSMQIPDPEPNWMRCHQNILELARDLPVGQYVRVKAEMLLADPRRMLGQICEWLGVSDAPEAIEAMLHPEASPFACLGPPSARYGNDPNFLKNPVIDFDRLARIKEPPLEGEVEWRPGEGFTQPVLKLARQFGYG